MPIRDKKHLSISVSLVIHAVGTMCIIAGFIVGGIYPMWIWGSTPSLTQMQLFLLVWKEFLGGIIGVFIGEYLYELGKEKKENGTKI